MAGTAILGELLGSHPGLTVRASWCGTPPFLARDRRVEWIRADLTDAESCRRLARGCDLAVMAAAVSAGAAGHANQPWRQVTDNLVMNARLLEAVHRAGVGRAVWIGSATCYQNAEGDLREEDLDGNADPPAAWFGVGWVARSVEKLCEFWHRQGLEVVVARTANIYGPFARFDPATSNFIPAIVRKAVERDEPFVVWGSPDVTRDVIFTGDFARGVAAMLADRRVPFGIFNLGSGEGVTVGEVVERSLEHAGHRPARVEWRQDRPTTVMRRVLDCRKLRDTLGWSPRITLDEGIEQTVRWWTENKDGWRR